MPIINGSDNMLSLNQNLSSSLLNSLDDDEESFVVLERSTASDMGLHLNHTGENSTQTSQILQDNCRPTLPAFDNSSQISLPAIRTSHANQGVPVDLVSMRFDSTTLSLSAEEIERRLQEVLCENISLKENLYQTNLAMKQQLSTVRLLQDRAFEVQKSHQAKFEETKALILKLGSEKTELQEVNNILAGDLSKLKKEIKELKESCSSTAMETTLKNENEHLKKLNFGFVTEIAKLKEENNQVVEANRGFSAEVAKLMEENKGLKETNIVLGTQTAKLMEENKGLKETNVELQTQTAKLMEENKGLKEVKLDLGTQTAKPSTKERELHELVDQLSRKLELVERARRQQEFDIDRLQAQIGRLTQELNDAQQKLALKENAQQVVQTQVRSENSLTFGDKFLKYDNFIKQLKASIQEEQTRFDSLNSWLSMTDPAGNSSSQFEISELRRLLAQEQAQSVARKDNLFNATTTIHELLGDFQKLGEELERVKADHAVKESHGLAYDEMQKKGFREQLDSLTAKLVEKEEALAISERHLASLQEAVRLQNTEKKEIDNTTPLHEQIQALKAEVSAKEQELQTRAREVDLLKIEVQKYQATNETIAVLQEQAKIYQADFEAERQSREKLVSEKERLSEDFRHLQGRNQDLIEEINKIRNGSPGKSVPRKASIQIFSKHAPSSVSMTARSPSPPEPKDIEHLDVDINRLVFHEKQEGNLCAQHCLNALLQGPHFNAVDLAELAEEMDRAEKVRLAEAGVGSKDYQSFLKTPSHNMDDTGFFSVQVISCALSLWGLEMIPWNSSEPRVIAAKNNLSSVKAFIINSNKHWFTFRRLGCHFYDLNSTLPEPKLVSDLYLDLFLSELQAKGNTVFVIFGNLPPCPADKLGVSPSDFQTREIISLQSSRLEENKSNNDSLNVRNISNQILLPEDNKHQKRRKYLHFSLTQRLNFNSFPQGEESCVN